MSVPELKMSASAVEDGVRLDESSVYSQVVFIDVPPSYPLYTDVTCCYKLTEGLIPSTKDWIGIYKVDAILEFLNAFLKERFLYLIYKSSSPNFHYFPEEVQKNTEYLYFSDCIVI